MMYWRQTLGRGLWWGWIGILIQPGICLPWVMVILRSNCHGILYLGQTPLTSIFTAHYGHVTSSELLFLPYPCTITFPWNFWHHRLLPSRCAHFHLVLSLLLENPPFYVWGILVFRRWCGMIILEWWHHPHTGVVLWPLSQPPESFPIFPHSGIV